MILCTGTIICNNCSKSFLHFVLLKKRHEQRRCTCNGLFRSLAALCAFPLPGLLLLNKLASCHIKFYL
ncbi:hypothetical protein AAZX31_17G110400 [Glycine max]